MSRWIAVCLMSFFVADLSIATDRGGFPDFTALSPNGRYQVSAKFPGNDGRPLGQAVQCECFDLSSGEKLWTRLWTKGEAYPQEIYISNNAISAILTFTSQLIAVDSDGKDLGSLHFIDEVFTEKERRRWVRYGSGGPTWSVFSLSYFLEDQPIDIFVFRPWWGRRVYIDTTNVRLLKPEAGKEQAAEQFERRLVLEALKSAANDGNIDDLSYEGQLGAYLAGQLGISDAVPHLRILEASEGHISIDLGGSDKLQDGDVDPFGQTTYGIRLISQLSLRRLGEVTFDLNTYEFGQILGENRTPFRIPKLDGPRHMNANKIVLGMTAKQVLIQLGSPDFVGDRDWTYDMNTVPPHSLILKFDGRIVKNITTRQPPTWKSNLKRDESIIYQ